MQITTLNRIWAVLDSERNLGDKLDGKPNYASIAGKNGVDLVLETANAIPGISVASGMATVAWGTAKLLAGVWGEAWSTCGKDTPKDGVFKFIAVNAWRSGLSSIGLGVAAILGGPLGNAINAVAAAKDAVDLGLAGVQAASNKGGSIPVKTEPAVSSAPEVLRALLDPAEDDLAWRRYEAGDLNLKLDQDAGPAEKKFVTHVLDLWKKGKLEEISDDQLPAIMNGAEISVARSTSFDNPYAYQATQLDAMIYARPGLRVTQFNKVHDFSQIKDSDIVLSLMIGPAEYFYRVKPEAKAR